MDAAWQQAMALLNPVARANASYPLCRFLCFMLPCPATACCLFQPLLSRANPAAAQLTLQYALPAGPLSCSPAVALSRRPPDHRTVQALKGVPQGILLLNYAVSG